MNRRDAFTAVALAGAAIAATAAPNQAAAQAATSTLDRIKRSGILRVAVIVGQEPYFHKDLPTGVWSGACIDMANDIASKLSAKVQTVESTWGNQILDLQGDKVDLAFAVNPTPERALVIDFSTPILVHAFSIITKKGMAKPQAWEEINKPEVKIAVDIGSTHEMIARRYCPKATILGFKNRDEAVLAVATGRADCTCVLAVLAISTLKKNPNLGEFVIPRPLLSLPTNMGIRAESDRRYKDFLSAWADYNRSMGQTREWMIKGFAALGMTIDDIPSEVQF
ncbi:transporter substrate-binding domain-containing protein [Phreatobacter stygius]|uniref:Transporter substrate-binding domain-containing protein n=1 Tax=Phreatobacter stygius TaxID=1940610 RepID=A0A4D7B8I7_9HYPH|nr:transporter substrate-binding domain-containing protein [Phreatobacter stygius]QCI66750.1 transporter substrate-binding domain-containing protein [Phreatobacter stygius]